MVQHEARETDRGQIILDVIDPTSVCFFKCDGKLKKGFRWGSKIISFVP